MFIENSGNIIKERRILKNISQKDLGNILGSQAMISRIENNLVLPNAQSLYLMCKELDITLEEYYSSYGQSVISSSIFKKKIDELFISGDIATLNTLYNQYSKDNYFDLKSRHKRLIIKAAIHRYNFKITDQNDQNSLYDYFNKIVNWKSYDINLLSATLHMLPVTKIRPYVADILFQNIQDVCHEKADECVLSLLLNLLESGIIQNKTIIIEWCLLKIKDYPIENNSNYYILYLFLITLYSNDKNKLEEIHRTVEFLNNESLKKYFLHIETFYYQKSAANF